MDDWTKIDIYTTAEGVEVLSASLMALGINGFEIRDPRDFEDFLAHKGAYWDYYDEELLKLKDAETTVTLYLPQSDQGGERLQDVKRELIRLKAADSQKEWGRLEYELSGVREEDWAFGWKKYYHAAKIGEKLVVRPSWEEYAAKPDEVVIKLDPGMAFGTGTHESTRLCMRLMEKYLEDGMKVLDLGCGSGILGISAALLGAAQVSGVDIDEVSVRVANENAALNDVSDKCGFTRDNLENRAGGSYGLVFANIVADVIIEYANLIVGNLSDQGILIASGIIDTREQDVACALRQSGLDIAERLVEGGWVALACKRQMD